jgi:tetratricopeptide (TPR) repeat protein
MEVMRATTASAWSRAMAALFLTVSTWTVASPALAAAPVPPTPAAPPAAVTPKISLAVIPFVGASTEVPEGFGEALGEAVRHGLRQVRAVRLVDSDDILAAGQRLNLSFADVLSDEAALKLAHELQVRGLVTGTYSLNGQALMVQAKIADVRAGGQVQPLEEIVGPPGEFLAGQERIARQLLQQVQAQLSPYDERRLQAAFTKQTKSLEAYVLFAQAMWRQGFRTREGHEQAIALLGKALEVDQNFALAHYALGISLYATSNRWKASGEFRKAIQLDGDFTDAYKWLGDLLVNSPRRLYDQAIQAYQKAVELSPDYAEAYVGLGDARQAKGQYDQAIVEYRKALHLEPENARVHFGLGKIYYNEKQLYHEAVSEYEQAIKLDPKFIEAHLNLADLYQEKGLYQEAVTRYTQVLSIDPRHPGATYGLAMAYEKVDSKKAIDEWEKYIDLASTLPSEKEWVDIAKKHLNKLRRAE